MLINVWVRDKYDGTIHQVGTDVHDSITTLDGKIVYYNLQNGDGSGFDNDSGYEVVKPPNMDAYMPVTPEQLYLNRELLHKDLIDKIMEDNKE